jgi:hypothetical protein
MMAKRPAKKRWSDLSPGQQMAVIIGAVLQIGLLAAALWDLSHRKNDEIRGDRRMWFALCFIDFLGPIAYFTIGRKDGCPWLRQCPWMRRQDGTTSQPVGAEPRDAEARHADVESPYDTESLSD